LVQISILAIIVIGLKGYYYSRIFLASYLASLYIIAWVYRIFLVQFLRAQMARGKWQRTFVLHGTHTTSEALIRLTTLRPELGWKYLGAADPSTLADTDELICAYAPGTSEFDAAENWSLERGIRFRFLPDMGPRYAGQLFLENLEGIPMFSQRNEPLSNTTNAVLKRIFDLVFTALGILFVLSWLLPIILLLQVLTGTIKPLFIQQREGLSGRTFSVWKFRTMNADGASNAFQRWMRRTGVDELPQLFNVLIGHMSLIGPRPHTPGDGADYYQKVSTYKIRYWAKPGLTGLAQTRGLRGGGAAATDELLEERIRADVYYIENWSLVLDLRILIETVVRTLFVPSTLQPKAR
jgi:lipopolysaccharide/colanic/teichoic acid biosynthesis glycosyltransferase